MIINKKIKRTMMEKKSQYVGSLILIIISCMMYTLLNQLASNLENISTSFEKTYVQEDASFVTDQKLGNIQDLESKFNLKLEESKSFDYSISKDKTLRIFSQNEKVNIPAVVKGNGLSGNDILIDPAFAGANKLNIGDSMDIKGKAYKISGFMSLPNYIYPLKSENDMLNDPNNFGIAVISKDDFDKINTGSSFYSVKFMGGGSLDSEVAQLKDYLKTNNIVILKWTDTSENPRIVYVNAKIDGQKKMSTTLPVFILLLTCILTGIVMWRMLKMEAVSTGTLYALGYRKKEIMRHYLVYPLTIALTGGIIGTIFGALLLKPLIDVMVSFFNMPVNSIDYSVKYIAISILLPVIFLCACSYFVINNILKYSPVELMRGGKEKGKVSFLEKKLKLDKMKFSTKFRTREQLRSIPRSIFLLLGVVLATMLLLLGFATQSSMSFLLKDTFESTYKYQYQYVFNALQHGQPSSGEAFSTSPFTLKSDSKTAISVVGVNPASKYIVLKDKAGNSLGTNTVVATRPLADKLNLKPGGTIQVVNKLDSREYDITVDSIAETYVGQYIYMPLPKFNDMLKYPSDSYIGLYSSEKLDIPESKLFNTATIDDLKNAFASMTQPLQYVVSIMAFLSFIIGLLVIYVVTSLIIEENKQNISLMKVLGYRKKELGKLILNSSTYLVVIGYILGVPLLLASLSVLFKSITADLNITFPVTINYVYVILGFVVIYLTYEISKALSRKKLNKISMNETLKAAME